MAVGPTNEHECEWREKAQALEEHSARLDSHIAKLNDVVSSLTDKVTSLSGELQTLKPHRFGRKTEKLPRIEDELRGESPVDWEAVQRERRERREARRKLEQVTTMHPVPKEERTCPKCGNT